MKSSATSQLSILVVLFVVFANCAVGRCQDSHALDVSSLKELIARTQERILGIDVAYWAGGYDESFPSGTYVYRELAVNRSGNFFHLSAHGHDDLCWKDDPYLQSAIGVANMWVHRKGLNNTIEYFEIDPTDELPGSLGGAFYFRATGLWPTERPRPKIDLSLVGICESDEYSFVEPELFDICGHKCHRLSNKKGDVLFLDIELGGVLVQRETLNPETGEVIRRILMSDFNMFSEDIWLPMKIETFHNNGSAISDAQEPTIIRVVKCDINSSIDGDRFNVEIPSGALIYRSDGTSSTSPGIETHLTFIASWCEKNSEFTAKPTAIWNKGVTSIAILICVVLLSVARWPKRIKKPDNPNFRRSIH